jgi:hypothetical protein
LNEKDKLDLITRRIIGAAIEVHKALGPGLLESAYETCLAFELRERGFKVEQQLPLPVIYKNVKLDCGYRLDLGYRRFSHPGDKGDSRTGADSRCSVAFISAAFWENCWPHHKFPCVRA